MASTPVHVTVSGASGNVSVKLPVTDGPVLLAITPSQVPYRVLQPAQVLVINLEGEVVEGEGIEVVE